jgi:hypothetical protein
LAIENNNCLTKKIGKKRKRKKTLRPEIRTSHLQKEKILTCDGGHKDFLKIFSQDGGIITSVTKYSKNKTLETSFFHSEFNGEEFITKSNYFSSDGLIKNHVKIEFEKDQIFYMKKEERNRDPKTGFSHYKRTILDNEKNELSMTYTKSSFLKPNKAYETIFEIEENTLLKGNLSVEAEYIKSQNTALNLFIELKKEFENEIKSFNIKPL